MNIFTKCREAIVDGIHALPDKARALADRLRWPMYVSAALGILSAFGLVLLYNALFLWLYDDIEMHRVLSMDMFPLFAAFMFLFFVAGLAICIAVVGALTGICRLVDRYAVLKQDAPMPSSSDAVISMVLSAVFVIVPEPLFALVWTCSMYGIKVFPRTIACTAIILLLSLMAVINVTAIISAPAAIISEIELRFWKKKHPVEDNTPKLPESVE